MGPTKPRPRRTPYFVHYATASGQMNIKFINKRVWGAF